MRVYRVEDGRGGGPYNGRKSYELSSDVYSNMRDYDRHPDPWRDGLGEHVTVQHRFGFHTLRALKAWFTLPIRKELAKHGFRVRAYDVPKDSVAKGRSGQVAFKRRRAKKVKTLDIVDLKLHN